MTQSELLGTTFNCTCGKTHTIPTEQFFYQGDAYELIPRTISDIIGGGKVLVIADTRTLKAAGTRVIEVLHRNGVDAEIYIIPDPPGDIPAADDSTRDLILKNAPVANLFVAVGSGVINDLVKWTAYIRKIPYIVVPTAASMNGYASANVAASIDGLKVLFHADACRAVFADPGVISDAPRSLTTAGLGDVLAKSVSSADWRLNNLLFDDYYCQFSVDLLKELEPVYLNNPIGIREKEPDSINALFSALLYSSIAMTMTGTSSPASGGEHLISHTLDMLAARDNLHHDLHGRQVGIGSIICAAIYEKVMALKTPTFTVTPEGVDTAFWGSLSPIVTKEYENKISRIQAASAYIQKKENWNRLRAEIAPGLVSARKLKECLKQAGAAHRYADLQFNGQPLDRDFFIRVVNNANQMRQRFTVLDVAIMAGIIPHETDSLVDEWLASE